MGQAKERARLVQKLLTAGMSASQISEITELTAEEIQKIQDSVAN